MHISFTSIQDFLLLTFFYIYVIIQIAKTKDEFKGDTIILPSNSEHRLQSDNIARHFL